MIIQNTNLQDFAIGILTGGNSSRMQSDKASLVLPDSQTLLEFMSKKFNNNLVFSSGTLVNTKQNNLVVPDLFDKKLGPVAGIVSSIKWLYQSYPDIKQCIFIPVDLAYITYDYVLRLLVTTYEICYFKGHPLPIKITISENTINICNSTINELQTLTGYPVYEFIQKFTSQYEVTNSEPRLLTNINYTNEWEKFLNEYLP